MILIDGLTLEEAREVIRNNKRPMESVIKWRTGEPKEEGYYLVTYQTLFGKYIEITEYEEYGWVNTSDCCKVLAWCPLNEIKSYKE